MAQGVWKTAVVLYECLTVVIQYESKHVAIGRDILYEIGLCLTDAFYFRFAYLICYYYYYYYYLLTYLLTAIKISPGGSSPYTSTDNINNNKYT
jgi:hypothetical protein